MSPSQTLPRSTPEEQGVSSVAILAFLDAVRASKSRLNSELHGFMLARRGHVIAEGWWAPYRPDAIHTLFSLSKSFTSTAIGFAVTEAKLNIDDHVVQFFPNDLPHHISENLAALRVRDLLTMSVGRVEESGALMRPENDWVKKFLSLPIEHAPGSVFLYDSGATYMLSAIVQKVSGQRVIDYLRPRLFEPLEMQGMEWTSCPLRINTGGWGLSANTEALLKLGQLYLQEGMWNRRQLLPAKWIRAATSFQVQQPAFFLDAGAESDRSDPVAALGSLRQTSDWHQGYGYQFWRCRHNVYRADGAFGQFCVVMPDQEAVVSINGETADIQGILNLVWEHLLPAMGEGALPPDGISSRRLQGELTSLTQTLPAGATISPIAEKLSGKSFQLDPNSLGAKSLSFGFDRESCVFELVHERGQSKVCCGIGKWVDGTTDMPGTPPELFRTIQSPTNKIAAAAAWRNDEIMEMQWRFYETPHHDTVTCRLNGDRIEIEFMNSIARAHISNPETRPILQGRLT